MAVEIFGAGRTALILTPNSGQVTTAGNSTLVTPASGNRLRIHYLSFNNTSATVECYFAFGSTQFLRNNVLANSVVAKDFGEFTAMQGTVDQALVLNLSVATTVNWNALYVEV